MRDYFVIYCNTNILSMSRYLLNNNRNSYDTLLIEFLMVLGVDLKLYLIQTLRLTPKSSKTSSYRRIKFVLSSSYLITAYVVVYC